MNAEATSWIAFGIAAVTMIGGCIKAMIDSRDKQFNTEQAVKVALLEERSQNAEERSKKCEESHAKTETRLAVLESLHGPGLCIPIDPDSVVIPPPKADDQTT